MQSRRTRPLRRATSVTYVDFVDATTIFWGPETIKYGLRFLTTAGVAPEDMVFRVCIHETADVEAAQRFWLAVTGADPRQFRSPMLKRHLTKTVRKNVGETYFGCLRVEVRQSGTLYRKIEAWASAAMSAA